MGIRLLKKIHYFKHLPSRALTRLMKIAKMRTFRAGELIFSKKEAGNHLFIVAEGKVRIFVDSASRKQKTFAVIGRGEFFGELALLDGTVRSASAKATDGATLLMVPRKAFQRFLLGDPKFMMLLLRTMAQRLRKSNETVESLLFKNILGRVANALLELNEKACQDLKRRTVPIQITHKELAAWVGTSREPLSRAIGTLRRGGLIETEDGSIRITNLAKLRKLTEF